MPTRVDGKAYGQILAADKHFKKAVKDTPTAELIQMSCSPAAGPAARESAESLHSAGIGLDVHATDKTYLYTQAVSAEPEPGLLRQDGEIILGHGSDTEVDQFDWPTKSPWVEYPAPRQRRDIQD